MVKHGIEALAVIYATNNIILHFEDNAHDISLSMLETDLEFMNKTGFFLYTALTAKVSVYDEFNNFM